MCIPNDENLHSRRICNSHTQDYSIVCKCSIHTYLTTMSHYFSKTIEYTPYGRHPNPVPQESVSHSMCHDRIQHPGGYWSNIYSHTPRNLHYVKRHAEMQCKMNIIGSCHPESEARFGYILFIIWVPFKRFHICKRTDTVADILCRVMELSPVENH